MFFRDALQVYRVEALAVIDWLDLGFGTRHSADWPAGAAASLKQVHSDICFRADSEGLMGHGDALISNQPGVMLTIRTADCTPVLLVDPVKRAVAAVHAGWRGTAQRIVPKAIAHMGEAYGSRPGDLLAAIGPAICGKCYEVGPEVAARFQEFFPERRDLDRTAFLDVADANRRQLLSAGVEPGNLFVAGLCTRCLSEEFHSYRREPQTRGRMISAVGIRS